MEQYEAKIISIELRKPLLTIVSGFAACTGLLLYWFELLYPFPIPIQPGIKTIVMIRWLIILLATLLALLTSLGYVLWKIKKLKEPVISPVVQGIINKVIDDKVSDKEIS